MTGQTWHVALTSIARDKELVIKMESWLHEEVTEGFIRKDHKEDFYLQVAAECYLLKKMKPLQRFIAFLC